MISTKIFSVKKTSILVVAVFTMAITIGLGPISSSMAVTDFINCNTEGDNDPTDNQINTVTSCHKQVNEGTDDSDDKSKAASNSNDDDDDESEDNVDVVKSAPQNIATSGPAVASPDDNIIKPINLNKGFGLDKPLPTNNAKHVQSTGNDDENAIKSKSVFEDGTSPNFSSKLDKSSSMSELYDSFDLPYTALYKN
jgi:hypothetical protein